MGSVMSLRNPSYIKISLRSNIDQSNKTGLIHWNNKKYIFYFLPIKGEDLIHSCGAISKMLGLQRSFSCGDILTISESEPVRHIRSDTFLHECEDYTLETPDANSGTCIAGDNNIKSSSQLPSPDAELVKVYFYIQVYRTFCLVGFRRG